MKGWVERELQEMLDANIIQKSKSPWSSPIMIAQKKASNRKVAPHLYVNYGEVNKITVKDAYPLPRTQEILEQMQGNPGYFTTLDLLAGFNQFKLSK